MKAGTEQRLADEQAAVAHAAVRACGGVAGASALAKRWGVGKARVAQIVRSDGFPAPLYAPHDAIPRWLVSEADAFREATK